MTLLSLFDDVYTDDNTRIGLPFIVAGYTNFNFLLEESVYVNNWNFVHATDDIKLDLLSRRKSLVHRFPLSNSSIINPFFVDTAGLCGHWTTQMRLGRDVFSRRTNGGQHEARLRSRSHDGRPRLHYSGRSLPLSKKI